MYMYVCSMKILLNQHPVLLVRLWHAACTATPSAWMLDPQAGKSITSVLIHDGRHLVLRWISCFVLLGEDASETVMDYSYW